MASTSSSHSNHKRFDVFLSFSGEDTRYAFTDHLYEALRRAAIHAFRDNDDIDRGEELTPRIKKGIKESKASIVVLFENYAKSKWCLNELLLILEERKNCSHFVLPVFYHVDPSDVRNQRLSFLIEADDGVEGSDWTLVNVNRWKAALTEVAHLAGMVAFVGPEADFIASIVETINHKLDLKLVSTPINLTAMETRAEYINSWLDNETPDDGVLAICGMGGSGKTTLAQYIYNSNKQKFASSSFLSHIGLESKQSHGLLRLKKQLITDIVGGYSTKIPLNNVGEGTSKIEEALQMNRVLIVLDDIDDENELHALLGKNCSNTNSKIIITTRHLSIQSWCKSTFLRCNVYKLESLNDDESLELLSRRAFGTKIPMEGFEDLAAQLAQYCEGNPLALNVLGSSLYTTAEDMQGRNDMIETWRSKLNLLNSSDGNVHSKIQRVLRRSFDSLPYDSEKELFLHIACFFVGEYKDYVATILEPDWHAKSRITTLINRCLLSISPGNKLIMHQLLQKMAKKIVNDRFKDPPRRSRVWNEIESYKVLCEGEGSKTIEGLSLDMRKLKQVMISKPISDAKTSSLSKMKKLKLLRLIDVGFDGDYNNFPDLIWLCWHKCHLKKIPDGLLMSSLVAIDMSNGECESFELPMGLNSLKILNLKGSHKLASIHKLNRVPYLESLILWDCSSLTYLCAGIGGLERLALLDLTGCKMLWNVAEGMLHHFGYLPASLEVLFLNDFFPEDSAYFPVVKSDQPQTRLYINLGNNQFKFLPKSFHKFELRVLDLTCCPNLEFLKSLPSTLEELYTYRCTSLKKITFQSARFKLRKFGYGGCTNLPEIQGLFKLVPIKELDDANLGLMKWIKQYQDHRMDLVGDEITKRRIWNIQMLYEYGIRSTFLPKDQSMNMPENMVSSPFVSFLVGPQRHRINGFILTSLYRSSGEDANKSVLFAKIINKTKGLTWIYNPVVFGKPKVDEDVVWLSYWPIRNIIEAGDEINVSVIGGNVLMVTGLAVKCVYASEVGHKNSEKHTKNVEVIGGDLSEFELTRGVYYLCRRDFLKSTAPADWLNMLIGDTFDHTELQGWRKSREMFDDELFMGLQNFRGNHCVANAIVERLPQRQEDRPLSGSDILSILPRQEDIPHSAGRFIADLFCSYS